MPMEGCGLEDSGDNRQSSGLLKMSMSSFLVPMNMILHDKGTIAADRIKIGNQLILRWRDYFGFPWPNIVECAEI